MRTQIRRTEKAPRHAWPFSPHICQKKLSWIQHNSMGTTTVSHSIMITLCKYIHIRTGSLSTLSLFLSKQTIAVVSGFCNRPLKRNHLAAYCQNQFLQSSSLLSQPQSLLATRQISKVKRGLLFCFVFWSRSMQLYRNQSRIECVPSNKKNNVF